MIRHFFLDKTNSVIENSDQNLGLNPILHIGYGKGIMRGLLHFDEKQIKDLIDDKTFADTDKLTFKLKMTNYFSIDNLPYEKPVMIGLGGNVRRAQSFDLVLFKLPRCWDQGRGFDFISDFWVKNNRSYVKQCSNWFFATNGWPWRAEEYLDYKDKDTNWNEVINNYNLEGGMYSKEMLACEYEKYLGDTASTYCTGCTGCSTGETIIVGSQHFDFGNENLEIDITDYVFGILNGEENYGLCLAFAPTYENEHLDTEEYVGFVTDNTNTFFHPYIEASYDEYISDDRESFTLGKKNELYLYTTDDGEPVNLDELPVCSINDTEFEVKQVTKGVYKATVEPQMVDMEEDCIYYDTWSQIALNGVAEDDVELEFATNPKSKKLRIGSDSAMKNDIVPSLYGINDAEVIQRGEIREVVVDFIKEYSNGSKELINSAEYRLYVKDGNREYDVLPYQRIEKAYLNNFFVIYTEDLIPNEYFVDIKVKTGRDVKKFNKVLRFTVSSNVTERYQ